MKRQNTEFSNENVTKRPHIERNGGRDAENDDNDSDASVHTKQVRYRQQGDSISRHSDPPISSSYRSAKPAVMMEEFEEDGDEDTGHRSFAPTLVHPQQQKQQQLPEKSAIPRISEQGRMNGGGTRIKKEEESEFTTYQQKLKTVSQNPEEIARGHAKLRTELGTSTSAPVKKIVIGKKKLAKSAASLVAASSRQKMQFEGEEDDSFVAHLQTIRSQQHKGEGGMNAFRSGNGGVLGDGNDDHSGGDESDVLGRSEEYQSNIRKALNNGKMVQQDGMDVYDAMAGDGDGEDDVHPMDPNQIPRGFMNQVQDAQGNIDYAKLTELTRRAQSNPRTKKLLDESVVAEDDEQKVATDVEGFLYEPCMLPQTYHERQVLRKMALAQLGVSRPPNSQSSNSSKKMLHAPKKLLSNSGGSGCGGSAAGAYNDDEVEVSLSSERGDTEWDREMERAKERECKGEEDEEKNGLALVQHNKSSNAVGHCTNEKEEEHVDVSDIDVDLRDVAVTSGEEGLLEGQSRSRCLMCSKGSNNSAAVPALALDNLMKSYVASLAHKDPMEAAIDTAEMFERCIRRPANRNRQVGEEEIPPLHAEMIYMHAEYHTIDPTFVLRKRLRQVSSHIDQIITSGLYRVPKSRTKPEAFTGPQRSYMNSAYRYRSIRPNDIVINPTHHKYLMDAIKLESALMKMDPTKLAFYSKERSLAASDTATTWINGNRPMYVASVDKSAQWSNVRNTF
jgi:hypothetical protein